MSGEGEESRQGEGLPPLEHLHLHLLEDLSRNMLEDLLIGDQIGSTNIIGPQIPFTIEAYFLVF